MDSANSELAGTVLEFKFIEFPHHSELMEPSSIGGFQSSNAQAANRRLGQVSSAKAPAGVLLTAQNSARALSSSTTNQKDCAAAPGAFLK